MSIIRDFARFIEPSGELSYDNTTSGLSGTTIKSAIDELSVLVGGGNVGSQATFDLYEFTATGGQTIFNLSQTFTEGNTITTGNFVTGVVYKITNVGDTDFTLIGAASNTLGEVFTATGPGGGTTGTAEVSITYVPGYIQVYVNGVFVAENDYTASDGQTIVLSESADASDLISLVVLDSFNTATQLRVLNIQADAPDNALTILTSGAVGIGTNSPSSVLEVTGTGDADTGILTTHSRAGVGYTLRLNNTNNGADKGSGVKWSSGGFDTAAIIGRSDAIAASADAPGYLTFHTSTDGSEDLAERLRIDSIGNVSIGGITPTGLLTLGTGTFSAAAANTSALYTSTTAGLVAVADGLLLVDRAGADVFKVDSSGNVGINESSPQFKLDVENVGGDAIRINGGSDFSGLRLTSTGGEWSVRTATSDALIFYDVTSASEVGRFDSSGNFLVGTTDDAPGAGNTISGVAIRGGSDNRSFFSVSSNYVAAFNRNTNDGSIVEFNKDGATVGSIGTFASDLNIGTGDCGIQFSGNNDGIYPYDPSSVNLRDALIDIGAPSARFKDLYLSGSAYTPVVQGIGDEAGLTFGSALVAPRKNNAAANGTVDLGASSARFKDLYLSGNVKLVADSAASAEIQLNQTGTGGRDYRISSTGSGYGSAGALVFYDATASSERARFDTSGNLLVGTDTVLNAADQFTNYKASGTLVSRTRSGSISDNDTVFFGSYATANSNNRAAELGIFKHSNITNAAAYLNLMTDSGTNTYYWTDASSNFRISTVAGHIGTLNGTVVGTQTSDERLKTIDPDFGYGINTIKQLVPIKYTFNDDETSTVKLGFGAQTTQGVVPESVYDTNECLDGYDEDPENEKIQTPKSEDNILAMEYVQLIPVLTKALQEAVEKIETLEAKVAQLES